MKNFKDFLFSLELVFVSNQFFDDFLLNGPKCHLNASIHRTSKFSKSFLYLKV